MRPAQQGNFLSPRPSGMSVLSRPVTFSLNRKVLRECRRPSMTTRSLTVYERAYRIGGQHREVKDHGEQQDQHQCRHHHQQQEARRRDSFKFLGATVSKDGTSATEVRIRIAMAAAEMAKLTQ
ncbi:hypothetical protein DPMN_134518 [Dreissena polymorpha]|uniref:Uncharacterized protein n=1 Tax=Dreissena polymorpha TaxID=45954 RepID=A0A9D4FZW1_DREPO|nr:hypothetical protein DPMN_134518 [Dreissena polymorpha]